MSDSPTNPTDKRVYTGIYRDRFKKEIQVLLVTKDIDTGEEIVVCKRRHHKSDESYFTMTKASFCAMVDTPKGPVPKYTRQTQYPETVGEMMDSKRMGFDTDKRIEYTRKKEARLHVGNVHRNLRRARTYYDYAKDLCSHRNEDVQRLKLCRESKKLIGIYKQNYDKLREDVVFTTQCLKTVLGQYSQLFYDRFGSKQMSIRAYAEYHGINRGSVVYEQEKLYRAFADELEKRDKADGITRLNTEPEEKDEDDFS